MGCFIQLIGSVVGPIPGLGWITRSSAYVCAEKKLSKTSIIGKYAMHLSKLLIFVCILFKCMVYYSIFVFINTLYYLYPLKVIYSCFLILY